MTCAEFILARVAEWEAMAEAATPGPWYWDEPSEDAWSTGDESLRSAGRKARDPNGNDMDFDDTVLYGWGHDASGISASDADRAHIAHHDPTRVLAQCAAYRMIVGIWGEVTPHYFAGEWVVGGGNGPEVYWDAIRALASIWADHPDFNPDWAM